MAAKMGATSVLKILTNDWNKDTLPQSNANDLLLDAMRSGNAETVQVVLALRDISPEMVVNLSPEMVVNLYGFSEDFLNDTASITQSYSIKHTKYLIQ